MERKEDVQLIYDILSGNDDAFSTLVQKYQKSVHALAWRKIRDFHHAEEITQDTFLQAYKKLSTLKNPHQFAGWLYVIANRLCINWLQRHKSAMQSLEGTSVREIHQSATVEMYDPKTDTWTQKADMPTPRSASTSVVNGKIYAIGGTALNQKQWRLDTVEVYDPATDTWARAKSMNHARDGAAISVVDGKIYVMGGTGWPQIPNHPGPFLSSMEVYNPKTNQWREIGDMPAAKSSHTASVIDGKIYVIGGFFRGNGLDVRYFKTIEIYHPETDRWTQKPDMPISKFGHAAEVINGNIYILTGADPDDAPFATVEVYAPEGFLQSVDPTGKLLKTWATIKIAQ